jgi:hypothetical protein
VNRVLRTLLSLTLLATGLTFAVAARTETKVEARNQNKVTICHRTAAVNNPYRRITVNESSIALRNQDSGHGSTAHNKWPQNPVSGLPNLTSRPDPNVFNPDWETTYYSVATNKDWGDIIPPTLDSGASYSHPQNIGALNYSDAGAAIYNGTTFNSVSYTGLCKRQSAAQLCESMMAEGATLAKCQEELNESKALDDAAALEACGGRSFADCSLDTLKSVGVRTATVTCVGKTPTLTGSASTSTVAHNVYFEYDTDEFLTPSTSPDRPTLIAATPATITGTGTFSAVLPELDDGTYYYRAVAIEPVNEGRLDGAIVSFTVADDGCTLLSTLEPELPPAPEQEPAPEAGGYFGRLKGVVWIDQNRNGKQDSNEPGLPFTPLTAEITRSAVSGQSVGRRSGVATASARKFTVNATTDAFGNYDIPSLEPGDWDVVAKLLTEALERTYDTGGLASDWFASARVPINGVGEADFAAAGNARVALTVEPTDACRRAKTVEVTWAGIDNKLGNKDDVTFVAAVSEQEALVRGLPWGSYTVTPICADGTRLATQKLVITKAQSTKVTKLTVELAPATPGVLPATGTNVNAFMLLLATVLIGFGAIAAVPRRRAQR